MCVCARACVGMQYLNNVQRIVVMRFNVAMCAFISGLSMSFTFHLIGRLCNRVQPIELLSIISPVYYQSTVSTQ